MKNFTLVLGSGGIKGLAHIGILKYLEEINETPDLIIGSSMGALVGALYCNGYSSEKIKELLLTSRSLKLLDFSLFNESLIGGKKIDDFLKKHLDLDFKDLKIPLIVNALNIKNGEEIKLDSGKVWEAVRASISIPGVFKPVNKDNMILVDAGFTIPTPVNFIPKSKKVIVIDVVSALLELDNPNLLDVLRQSLYVSQKNAAQRTKELFLEQSKFDEFIYVKVDLAKYFALNFLKKDEEYIKIINKGYDYAKKHI